MGNAPKYLKLTSKGWRERTIPERAECGEKELKNSLYTTQISHGWFGIAQWTRLLILLKIPLNFSVGVGLVPFEIYGFSF